MVEYHEKLRDMKGEHFSSMKYHKSADADLRNRGLLRILEIGAGSGIEFELKTLLNVTFVEKRKSAFRYSSAYSVTLETDFAFLRAVSLLMVDKCFPHTLPLQKLLNLFGTSHQTSE